MTVAALNFSDVLKTMGLYPGLNGQAPVIGGECIGVITAVGDGVDSVQVGQRVLAVAPGTLGSHVTTVEDLVVPVPDALSDTGCHVRRGVHDGVAFVAGGRDGLAPGERVLIHSATGGVGLAAMGIAKIDRSAGVCRRPERTPSGNCCPSSVPSMSAIRAVWPSPTRYSRSPTAQASTSS